MKQKLFVSFFQEVDSLPGMDLNVFLELHTLVFEIVMISVMMSTMYKQWFYGKTRMQTANEVPFIQLNIKYFMNMS